MLFRSHEHEDTNQTFIATFKVHNPAIFNKSIKEVALSLFLDGVMNLLVALLTVKIIRHQQPDVIETDEFEIK